jgi:hypothetical protein
MRSHFVAFGRPKNCGLYTGYKRANMSPDFTDHSFTQPLPQIGGDTVSFAYYRDYRRNWLTLKI